MSVLTIILMAVSLAMDCFSVSIAQGLNADRHDCLNRPKPALMASLFGIFQGGMPLVGYFAGALCGEFFYRFAPWVALILLSLIGGKMIYESLHKNDEKVYSSEWGMGRLLLLAVATSIDALATGVIFIPYPQSLWLAVAIIGVTSLLFSAAGYLMGVYIGERFKVNVTLIGGIILVAIGLKIWIEGICL